MSSLTAGIVMIGDEILKGQIIDTNSNFLTKRLHSLGVKVCKIVIVCDDVDEIAKEVAQFSKKYTFVITSGGIGPTHDDVTYSGIAKAFNDPIILNAEVARILQRFYPGSVTDVKANPALKMAQIPKSSKLLYPNVSKHPSDSSPAFGVNLPIIQVNNVYIFPGIPELFEYCFEHLEYLFKNETNCTFYTRQLYLNVGEVQITPILNCTVDKYAPNVVFGSYPSLSSNYYSTKLTIESTSKDQAREAEEFLRRELPTDSIVACTHNLPAMTSVYDVAQTMTRGTFSIAVKNAVKVLEECCDKYIPSEIFLSFNGGKDCTVLLHMACEVFKHKFPNSKEKLQAVYIKSQDPFPEVESFIEESCKRHVSSS